MTEGYDDTTATAPPMNGEYDVYSLEELFTIEFNNVLTETHSSYSGLG